MSFADGSSYPPDSRSHNFATSLFSFRFSGKGASLKDVLTQVTVAGSVGAIELDSFFSILTFFPKMNPKHVVEAGYDLIALTYQAWAAKDANRSHFLLRFSQLVKPNSKVLDLGCGPGETSRTLKEMGFETCGADLSGQQISLAEQAVPDASFVQGDMTNENLFGPEAFDGITAFYSLIHVPRHDHSRVLKNVAKWLRPEGKKENGISFFLILAI